jgi:hypothetical protein
MSMQWTERGDFKHAGKEEGRSQEGRNEEEEVGAPGCVGRGGGPITSPFSFPVSKEVDTDARQEEGSQEEEEVSPPLRAREGSRAIGHEAGGGEESHPLASFMRGGTPRRA